VEQLAGAGDVLVVELDAHVAGEAVGFGVPAGKPDELGLWDGHPLTFEGEVDRPLLDDRVDVVAPRVVVHEDIHGQPLLLVQPPRQAPDPPFSARTCSSSRSAASDTSRSSISGSDSSWVSNVFSCEFLIVCFVR